MNGQPPLIRIAYRDEDGELQLTETCEISVFGCVPAVGDIIFDALPEFHGPTKVRRRAFVPAIGEQDTWWILVDPLPDDMEISLLGTFDAEIKAEFKAIAEEYQEERRQEWRKQLDAEHAARAAAREAEREQKRRIRSAEREARLDAKRKVTIAKREAKEAKKALKKAESLGSKLDLGNRDPDYWTPERKETLRAKRESRVATRSNKKT